MTAGRRVCVAAITAAHGVRGAVRVKPFTAEADSVAAYGPVEDESGARTFRLSIVGHAKDQLIVKIEGITDRDQAEALRGLRLYVPRAALPEAAEDEYYHADLVGLVARTADGETAGEVRAVHEFGAGDMLEIVRPGRPPLMVPFTRAAVPTIDLAGGFLVVDPPAGLDSGGDGSGEGEG